MTPAFLRLLEHAGLFSASKHRKEKSAFLRLLEDDKGACNNKTTGKAGGSDLRGF